MIAEWMDTLLHYYFKTSYVPGVQNQLSDSLSRMHESVQFSTLTVEHLDRDKTMPASEGERRSIIESAHQFGHLEQQEVCMKVWNDGYWWREIRRVIANALSECTPCQRYNIQKKGFHPLKEITAELPWDHIAIDLVTPLPLTKNGEDTLLVVVDIMTKFAILRTLKGKGMEGIAKALWKIMSLFGAPKIIQSDNGSDFVNQVVEELVKLNGIDHRTISAYNSRANGAAERVNGIREGMLKKELQGAMHEWAE